ncbi:MAG: hypothetical protein IKK52_07000 [Alphaproteobacteria bacterium]|nr:hypothetical protein [Alphaproteobacteria bacterium]
MIGSNSWPVFFVLFAIIDIPGSLPYILSLRNRGKIIKPAKTAVMAFVMFMMFYVAGAGALTTMLAIRSQFAPLNLILGVAANMVCVYLVLRTVDFIAKIVNSGILYMIKKFFGIILLTISIKLFTANIMLLLEKFWPHIN